MEFIKFNSLENTYRFDISTVEVDCDWVVTEKLDGANFSFYYNGKDLKVASRNQFVNGTFFNCQPVIDKYSDNIISWYGDNLNCGDVLIVTGELIGSKIQKRVNYKMPDNMNVDFYAFDIRINSESISPVQLHEMEFIPVVPLIGIMSLDEALGLNPTFLSKIGTSNAEGLAIVPSVNLTDNFGRRIHLKKKCQAFSEKSKTRKPKEIKEFNEYDNKRLTDLLQLSNKNRVLSTLSKTGRDCKFGILVNIILEDILEDFRNEYGICPFKGTENMKDIIKELKGDISKEIRLELFR